MVSAPTDTRDPGLTVMPDRRSALNDGIATSIVYVSAETFGKTKSPVALLTTGVDFVPLVSLVNVTVAPGITPPWTSWTVPEPVPVVICADAGRAIDASRHSAGASRRRVLTGIL